MPRAMRGPLTEEERAFCERNRFWALHVARTYRGPGRLTIEERQSAAMWGLIRAAQGYRKERGFAETTYTSKCVWLTIFGEAVHDRLIRVPAHVAEESAAVSPGQVAAARRTAYPWSLDYVYEGGLTLEIPASPEPEPDLDDDLPRLRAALESLPDRLRRVVRGRIDGRTLRELEAELGVTRERVRQLYNHALRQLRKAMGVPS